MLIFDKQGFIFLSQSLCDTGTEWPSRLRAFCYLRKAWQSGLPSSPFCQKRSLPGHTVDFLYNDYILMRLQVSMHPSGRATSWAEIALTMANDSDLLGLLFLRLTSFICWILITMQFFSQCRGLQKRIHPENLVLLTVLFSYICIARAQKKEGLLQLRVQTLGSNAFQCRRILHASLCLVQRT